jgi:hypothetical protein
MHESTTCNGHGVTGSVSVDYRWPPLSIIGSLSMGRKTRRWLLAQRDNARRERIVGRQLMDRNNGRDMEKGPPLGATVTRKGASSHLYLAT